MRLSIITINLNNLDGLKKTIDSIMSQTWRDFEWIIVDGGSTDGSKNLIEQTAANPDSNISWWCSEPDKGIYNAMNKGIRHANGEYLSFMNSGDCFYERDTLHTSIGGERNNIDVDVFWGNWAIQTNNSVKKMQLPESVDILFFYKSNICHQASFVKRKCLSESGYDERYKILADWKKWHELLLCGCSFKKINAFVCIVESGGISQCLLEEGHKEYSSFMSELYPVQIIDLLEEMYVINEQKPARAIIQLISSRRLFKRLFNLTFEFAKYIDKVFPSKSPVDR